MYRWVDHTGEVELAIEAKTEPEVFSDALAALAELLAIEGEPDERRVIELKAPDRATLLAAWLEELLFLADAEGFEPRALRKLDLGSDGLNAVVAGRYGDPSPLVKAVTYHRLAFEPQGAGYRATVVLDV
jgi:SHS2 domain-containing protein